MYLYININHKNHVKRAYKALCEMDEFSIGDYIGSTLINTFRMRTPSADYIAFPKDTELTDRIVIGRNQSWMRIETDDLERLMWLMDRLGFDKLEIRAVENTLTSSRHFQGFVD